MSEHAFLAPSSAGTWGPGGCPASPRMQAAFPQPEDTEEAREGTAAHWVLKERAGGRTPAIGALADNGYPVTQEMIDGTDDMVRDMRQLIDAGLPHLIEARVNMPQIHPTLNWGSCDFGAIDLENKVIHVWDFKFGYGYVDVFENWQLIDYALGVANYFGATVTPEWQIDAVIYQPRSFHAEGSVKPWVCQGAHFINLVIALQKAAAAAVDPNAPMATGAHCKHCSARHACPAFQRVAGASMDLSLRGVPHVLSPANAGLALKMVTAALDRLEAFKVGLEAQVLAAVRAGDATTGHAVEQGFGRERFAYPVAEVLAMGELLGLELAKPAALITPNQARDQARKKGIDEAVISAYSERPKGEIKLKPLDDKSIRKAFQ